MAQTKLPVEKEAELIAADRELEAILPDLDNWEKCGGDATPYRAIIMDVRNRIQNVRKYFGTIAHQ